jgi:hypothetical protein
MRIKEWAWDINWVNAILWTMGFIVVRNWIFGSSWEYEIFGFWVATIIEFLFIFLIVLLVKPWGVKKEYIITHNKCHKQFSSLIEYNKHIKICKGK